jgi:hypothetical protein
LYDFGFGGERVMTINGMSHLLSRNMNYCAKSEKYVLGLWPIFHVILKKLEKV